MRVRVRNLEKYQHYATRKPPWLKLHRGILDNHYAKLPASSWRLGLEIALLCSESEDGTIDASSDALSWRLRRRVREADVTALLSEGFLERLHDASNALAGCKQNGVSETETETETEKNYMRTDVRCVCFDTWWETYRDGIKPRPMRDKTACRKLWGKENWTEKQQLALVAKLEEQITARKQHHGKTFVPNLPDPIRYLKRRLWTEELDV